ncbi:hypothetical protein [Mesobacillus stamsii]|uniref:DUF4367 domain-containing protein n=1 Tax=Mesobacillus stamsii TaxID=225347 RepID=A0ABU0FSL9_9BACI|nr:hypothetical protein [Mesobacillus stamsii]MDQ0412830.1 hypothetical protein [Mesobacillus stamsii]
MKKLSKTLFLLGFLFAILGSIAFAKDEIISKYEGLGYTSSKEAITKFENKYKHLIFADTKLIANAPFKITHNFGSYQLKDEFLTLEYLNVDSNSLFKVMVFPEKNAIPLSSQEQIGAFSDGSNYSYMQEDDFLIFRFSTSNYAYVLSTNHFVRESRLGIRYFTNLAESIKKSE